MELIAENLSELKNISKVIIDKIDKFPYIIHLIGDLGFGKTALATDLIKTLGVKDLVTSPTFTFLKNYNTEKFTIYHFDLYRIDEKASIDQIADTLNQIGYWQAIDDPNSIILIEWPSRAIELLTKADLTIVIERNGESRKFKLNYK
jgi:tRNA threonylcarbamoyladenosine biosynthesis protein TsaE